MEQIVFLDRDTIAPHIKVRRPHFEHRWAQYGATSGDQVVGRLQDATIAISNKVPLRPETLEQLSHLRLIAVAATGYDCVDTAYCGTHRITVSNIRGYAVNTVPEHTFALILALRRSLFGYRQDVIDGAWERAKQFCIFNHPIRELAGSNLVIIGAGSLGQSVAALGRAFGMNVIFAAHKGSTGFGRLYTPWDEALRIADVVSIHCPLVPATEGMIGMIEFQAMERKPLLINTARGKLVVEKDLEQAMYQGLISGAGFDVAEVEPIRSDSPLMRLMKLPNFVLTPHVAWASDEAQQALADQIIDNVENFVRGEPSNVVV